MLEGIYFQFPKLSFILFFFLACEALCPLRSNPIYFPRNTLFGTQESKPPLWMWVAKWAMISFFIVALMSPVREVKEEAKELKEKAQKKLEELKTAFTKLTRGERKKTLEQSIQEIN